MHIRKQTPNVNFYSFRGTRGLPESWLYIELTENFNDFSSSLEAISDVFRESIDSFELHSGCLLFSRIFLSDIVNQKEVLLESSIYRELKKGVVSVIGQPPISKSGISLLACFAGNNKNPAQLKTEHFPDVGLQNGILFKGINYNMLWTANYCFDGVSDSEGQTRRIFGTYLSHLKSLGMNLKENGIRTWIFVHDIDNHYGGMVKARREIFSENFLTEKSRYPASTGIEGCSGKPEGLVSMDALAMSGMKQGQVSGMKATEFMPPTTNYGVTFERGIKVTFADRSHLHISGTASIDREGKVVYKGDIVRQAERTILNTGNLLERYGASFGDLAYLIVYVRDISNAKEAVEKIRGLIPAHVPLINLHAPVCRPAWLVEVEGLAVIEDKSEYPAFF